MKSGRIWLQPFGTGPFFPGSSSFVAKRRPVSVAPLSSIREKMAPVAAHPYMSIHPRDEYKKSGSDEEALQERLRRNRDFVMKGGNGSAFWRFFEDVGNIRPDLGLDGASGAM